MQAGEEMLRSKPDGKGGFVENSYKSPDIVNSIKWNLLEKAEYQDALDYYKGLIQFRKAHPVLRMTSVVDILSNLIPVHCAHPHVGAFHLRGEVNGEPSKEMYLIFSASDSAETLKLPEGKWNICINHNKAGIETLEVVENQVTIEPISAMVLVR